MITSHHSFSTRIFLKEAPASNLRPASPAPMERKAPDEIRDFWWFLRAGRNHPALKNQGPGATHNTETRHA